MPVVQDAELKGLTIAARIAESVSFRSRVALYSAIFLLALATSTESQSTFTLNPYITSAFQVHTMLSTVSIVSNLLSTVLKAPIAKLADVFGRLEVFIIGVLAFVLGFICIANSRNIATYLLSQILYSIGSNGCIIIVQLLIADTSTLHDRALLASLPTTPFLAAVWLGPWLGDRFLRGVGWRWGVGLWAFILPIAATPLVIVLMLNRHRVLKAMAVSSPASREPASDEPALAQPESGGAACARRALGHMAQIDLPGSLLLALGLSLLLLPLTLANQESMGWRDPGIIYSIICGPIVLGGFLAYERHMATSPIVSIEVMGERVVLAGCAAAVFFFATFYIFDIYQTSYFQVVNGVSPAAAGYVNNVYAFGSTVMSICVGFCIKYFKKVRPFILAGSACFLVGILSLAISVERHCGIKMMVFSMALYAIGAGAFAMPAQTAVQSVCQKRDVGAVTGLFLTCTMLGGSVGSAISGAMWPTLLLRSLLHKLPAEYQPYARDIANDLNKALSYPMGSPARNAINDSYKSAYRSLVYLSLATAVIFSILTWFIKCEALDMRKDPMPTEEQCSNEPEAV